MLLIENIENRLLQVNPLSIFNPHNPNFYNHQHIAQTRIRIIPISIHSAQLLPCIVSTKIIIVLKYSALFFNKHGLFYPICGLFCSYSALRCNSLHCIGNIRHCIEIIPHCIQIIPHCLSLFDHCLVSFAFCLNTSLHCCRKSTIIAPPFAFRPICSPHRPTHKPKAAKKPACPAHTPHTESLHHTERP